MYKTLIGIFLLMSAAVNAQTQDFEWAGHAWSGDTKHFKIDNDVLKLNYSADTAATSRLLVDDVDAAEITEWRLMMNYKNAVTEANFARFYLLVNPLDYTSFISLDLGNNDKKRKKIEITFSNKGVYHYSATCETTYTAPDTINIIVRRYDDEENANLTLYLLDKEGNDTIEERTAQFPLNELSEMTRTGLNLIYTKYRSTNNFFFHSFSISTELAETTEPSEPEEPIEPEEPTEPEDPTDPQEPSSDEVEEIKCKNIIARGDVVISEVMANPKTDGELPKPEYVEIYNRTDSVINLAHWTFGTTARAGELDSTIIKPNEYALLVASSRKTYFADTLKVIGSYRRKFAICL